MTNRLATVTPDLRAKIGYRHTMIGAVFNSLRNDAAIGRFVSFPEYVALHFASLWVTSTAVNIDIRLRKFDSQAA